MEENKNQDELTIDKLIKHLRRALNDIRRALDGEGEATK